MGARLTRFALTNLENFHRSSFFFLVEVEVTLSVISFLDFYASAIAKHAKKQVTCSIVHSA